MQVLIDHVQSGGELNREQVQQAAASLLDESQSPDSKATFLQCLHERRETPGEIAAFVHAFLDHALVPPLTAEEAPGPLIDVCGTGGDKLDLFNISTASIFVLAAGGLAVVKHGNRGITSQSGGADVLEALGVPIDLPPEAFADCVKAHGAGFLFAPQYHPAFKAVAPARKILGERGQKSLFNLIGPLLNPVRPAYQMIGVFDASLPPVYASILSELGRDHAWAVHGKTADGRGVDEISIMGPTDVHRCRKGEENDSWTVTLDDLGLDPCQVEELQGGDGAVNAAILEGILSGEIEGPKRDIVLVNAGAAFVITGVSPDLQGGMALARELIDRGSALDKLRALQNFGSRPL